MYRKESLPACYRYINTEKRNHILFTLVSMFSKEKGQDFSSKNFHSLLCASGLASTEDPLPNILENISCFTVVSDYKCGFICSFCPYCARYKNQFVSEEEMLISHCLKGFNHYKFLKNNGLSAHLFQSLFLINEFPYGKIVPTLPLLRLTYNYIEHTVKPDSDFNSLPTAIAESLDCNNPEKLLPQNIQTIREILIRLQKEYKDLKEKDIKELIEKCKNPSLVQLTLSVKTPEKQPSLTPTVSSECLNGLLPNTNHVKKSTANNITVEIDKEKSVLQTRTSGKTNFSKNKPVQMDTITESLFLPSSFSIEEAAQTAYSFHPLGTSDFELRDFEAFLLYNPIIGLEVVSEKETQETALLLFASNQFYFTYADEENVLSLLRTYFSKSRLRRQICLDPYRLYAFMGKNHLPYLNIYSLRTSYKVLKTAQQLPFLKTPSAMIKELSSRENQYKLPLYIFAMSYYVKMYEVLEANPILKQETQKKEFSLLSGIDALLGISYELKDIAETTDSLFSLNQNGEYCFSYKPNMKMRPGIFSITFYFSAPGQTKELIFRILFQFTKESFAEKFGYRLLQFTENSFSIATTEENYPQLQEIVANLSTYFAGQQGLLPLTVKEEKHI